MTNERLRLALNTVNAALQSGSLEETLVAIRSRKWLDGPTDEEMAEISDMTVEQIIHQLLN